MRYWLSFVLACAVFSGVSCGSRPQIGVQVDPALRRLVPLDAAVLAGVDLEKLEKTPLYRRYEGQLNQAGLDALTERFGIDPRRDIASVLIAANADRRIALTRGRFTQQQLEPKLISMRMQRTLYKGHAVFGDARNSLTFASKGVLAAGSKAAVRDWVDRVEDGRGGISDGLQRRLAALPKNDTVWVVSDGGLPLVGVPLRQDVESALSNIEGFVTGVTAGAAVDSGVHFRTDFDCISPEGAQRVHDALRGGIGLARLTTNDNALDMLRLYDSIQVSKEDKRVHVGADLSSDLTDKVWAHVPQLMEHVNRALQNGQ